MYSKVWEPLVYRRYIIKDVIYYLWKYIIRDVIYYLSSTIYEDLGDIFLTGILSWAFKKTLGRQWIM